MTTMEMDPDFSKGLRLMFSSAKDSTEMLRTLLEDAIRAKHGTSKSIGNIPVAAIPKDDDEMCIVLERDSDESVSEKDDDDDEVRALMEEDLSCSVCKEISVSHGNRLIECCECQALYHQECHKPSISDKDVDDPRKTWYCSSCKQATAEVVKQTTSKTSSPSGGPSKSLRSSPALNRDSPSNQKTTVTQGKTDTSSLFKRSDKQSTGSNSSSSSSSKPSGLAAMAASLQSSKSSGSSSSKGGVTGGNKGTSSPSKGSFSSGSSKSTSSSGSGSSSGKISSFSGVPSPTDKRLQNMKKKAAATKLQEKRKHSK